MRGGHSPGSFFSREAVAGLNAKYTALMGSLHHLSIEMEAKEFPKPSHREMTHRSAAVSSAVRVLLDGKTPPPLEGKNKKRGETYFEDLDNIDEELL